MVALIQPSQLLKTHHLIEATWLIWHPFLAFGQPGLHCVDHVLSLRASHKFHLQAPAKGLVNYCVCGRTQHIPINDYNDIQKWVIFPFSIKIGFVDLNQQYCFSPQHYVTITILKCNEQFAYLLLLMKWLEIAQKQFSAFI